MGELLSHNLFSYCDNNAINREDPEGHFWRAIAATIGAVISIPVQTVALAAVATALTIGYVGYMGYDWYTRTHVTYADSTNSELPVSGSKASPKGKTKSKQKTKSKTFPNNSKEMDDILEVPGKKVKDGPTTPGRNKIKWKVSEDVSVTYEQHPYHRRAPIEHKGPHYHVEAPNHGYDHTRFLSGD